MHECQTMGLILFDTEHKESYNLLMAERTGSIQPGDKSALRDIEKQFSRDPFKNRATDYREMYYRQLSEVCDVTGEDPNEIEEQHAQGYDADKEGSIDVKRYKDLLSKLKAGQIVLDPLTPSLAEVHYRLGLDCLRKSENSKKVSWRFGKDNEDKGFGHLKTAHQAEPNNLRYVYGLFRANSERTPDVRGQERTDMLDAYHMTLFGKPRSSALRRRS